MLEAVTPVSQLGRPAMEPSGKRGRTSEATETALSSGLPARSVARLSQALGGPSTTRHEMHRALEDLATLRTVYGPMTGNMSVPLVGGGELDIMYVTQWQPPQTPSPQRCPVRVPRARPA